jgi:hypothetical protein
VLVVRVAEAETRVVKTRHPPASLASSGPEPLGARLLSPRRPPRPDERSGAR